MSKPKTVVHTVCSKCKGTGQMTVPDTYARCLKAIRMLCAANGSASVAEIHKLAGMGNHSTSTHQHVARLIEMGVLLKSVECLPPNRSRPLKVVLA